MRFGSHALAGAFCLALTTAAGAIELPAQRLAPGGVAEVALPPSGAPPRVTVDGVPVLVLADAGRWKAVVGIALSRSPGKLHLEVRRDGVPVSGIDVPVQPYRYAVQRLTVAPGQVDLAPADLARYETEKAHLAEVVASFDDTVPATLALMNTRGRR